MSLVFVKQDHSSHFIDLLMLSYPTETGKGKLSEKANLNYGKSSVRNGEKIITYKIKFQVEQEFGIPGAILIKNKDKHRFFLQSASLSIPNNQTIQFDCNSWVYPVKQTGADRVFFSNTVSICPVWILFFHIREC